MPMGGEKSSDGDDTSSATNSEHAGWKSITVLAQTFAVVFGAAGSLIGSYSAFGLQHGVWRWRWGGGCVGPRARVLLYWRASCAGHHLAGRDQLGEAAHDGHVPASGCVPTAHPRCGAAAA